MAAAGRRRNVAWRARTDADQNGHLSAAARSADIGAITIIWQALPEFRQIAINPGAQLPRNGFSDLISFGVLCVMQFAFWYRALRVPIPFRYPQIFLNHLFLFLGRLGFIFGSALFGIVVFRHLPELDQGIDMLLAAKARNDPARMPVRAVLHQP